MDEYSLLDPYAVHVESGVYDIIDTSVAKITMRMTNDTVTADVMAFDDHLELVPSGNYDVKIGEGADANGEQPNLYIYGYVGDTLQWANLRVHADEFRVNVSNIASEKMRVTGGIQAGGTFISSDGSDGATGFIGVESGIATVKNGIITNIP